MSKLKLRALMGMSVLAASAALAANANASSLYGAGSTLVQPYWAQVRDCYGSVPAVEAPVLDVCASALTANSVSYKGTGSGTGIAAIGSHNPTTIGDVDPVAAGTQLYPRVSYALSETSLTAANVTAYNNGGAFGSTTIASGGIDQLYGKVVQFPVAVAPVAIAYDPVYKKINNAGAVTSYSLQFATTSGKLELSREAYCKIFNGTITNWNDPVLAALGVSGDPADPVAFTAPIVLVGRSESSGTSSLFTRHIAKVCGDLEAAATIPVNYYVDSGSTLTAASSSTAPLNSAGKIALLDQNNDQVVDFIYNKANNNRTVLGLPGRYVLAEGSDGVAKYVDFTETPAVGQTFTQARIGYVGADYTLPNAPNAGLAFAIDSAVLENSVGAYVDASPANATAAFATLLPPDTDVSDPSFPDGKFDAAQPGDRTAPDNWAELAVRNPSTGLFSDLADPTDGYPIVGTVNWLSYSCYASGNGVDAITNGSNTGIIGSFLFDPIVDGIFTNAGLAPLPTIWRQAIDETFLHPTGSAGALGLGFNVAGSGNCSSVSPGA